MYLVRKTDPDTNKTQTPFPFHIYNSELGILLDREPTSQQKVDVNQRSRVIIRKLHLISSPPKCNTASDLIPH